MAISMADLSDAEFSERRPRMIEGYARELSKNFGIPIEQARVDADRQLDEMLPDGVRSAGQLLRTAVDDGVPVGFLWVSLPGTVYPAMAWLSEIEVADGHRSRGYGTRMIAAAEADLVARGVRRIGLHVFGDNAGARRLYRRLGYHLLSQARGRRIAVAEPGDQVTLTPMSRPEYDEQVAALLLEDPDAQAKLAKGLLPADGVVTCKTAAGWISYSLPEPGRPAIGTIHYLVVDEDQRRRGHGRAMVTAVEAELARQGVPEVSLNVVGPDPGAVRFVDRLGYEVLSEQLVKDL